MPNRPSVWPMLVTLAAVLGPGAALAQNRPISVIDWLSKSVDAPAPAAAPEQQLAAAPAARNNASPNGTQANLPPRAGEAAISGVAPPEVLATTVLGRPSLNAVGLLPPSVTGFPRTLWGIGRTAEIAGLIAEVPQGQLPALNALFVTLLLAEAEAPADSGTEGSLLLARVDQLLAIGALDQAQALLDLAGASATPEIFRRSFDIALLTGNEDRICAALKETPAVAPTLTTRVFCLARQSDWNAAALTLRTAQALGNIDGIEDELLTRFLDPDQFGDTPLPAPPRPVTPLIWRIYDALGEPISTATLPPAFAHADLSEQAGWKAQIEAAERLARLGAVTPNVLLGLYTERAPAASGGVWDRADAFQRFDAALTRGDKAIIEQRLPLAYARMKDVELEAPFAALFAARLARLELTGDAGRIAFELGLISADYERLSKLNAPGDARAAFLAGLASGNVTGLVAPDSLARAIQPAFTAPQLPEDVTELLAQNRVGEAILQAMLRIDSGLHGEMVKLTEGLSILRRLGLEDVARRTALQMMLLERRG